MNLLSKHQAATLADVTIQTIDNWTKFRGLPVVRVGAHPLYDKAALEDFVAKSLTAGWRRLDLIQGAA
jgi:phage terminase Nu1 subunit (DNA packaging protein)